MGIKIKTALFPAEKRSGISPDSAQRSKKHPCPILQLNADIEMEIKGKAIANNIYPGPTDQYPYQHQDTHKYKLGLPIGRTRKKDCYIFDLNDAHPYLMIVAAHQDRENQTP